MQICRLFLFVLMFMLVSCLETADPDVCGNYINTNQITAVSVISTTQINGVKAYTDNKVLCENVNELLYRKKKDEQFYHYSYNEEDVNPEYEDWFVELGCYVKHDADIENKSVFFQFEENGKLNVLNIDSLLIGKTNVFAISERDTAWLFSYRSSLSVDDDPDHNFTNSSRMGCRDGYCFVSLPMREKELCFDR